MLKKFPLTYINELNLNWMIASQVVRLPGTSAGCPSVVITMPLSQYIATLWWILSKFYQIFFAIMGVYDCLVTEQTFVVRTSSFDWWLLFTLLIGFCVWPSFFFYCSWFWLIFFAGISFALYHLKHNSWSHLQIFMENVLAIPKVKLLALWFDLNQRPAFHQQYIDCKDLWKQIKNYSLLWRVYFCVNATNRSGCISYGMARVTTKAHVTRT